MSLISLSDSRSFFLSVSREPDNDNSTPEHPEKVILLPDYQLYNYNYL
jgi:hypothetical protein